jgi:hypothetical protein
MGSTSFGSQSRGGGFGLEQGRDRYGANFMGSWGGAEWGVDYGAGIHAGAARNRSYEGRSGGRSGTLDRDRPNHRGKGPKGYKRNDERIKEDVSEALQNDYDVDASNIEVEVNDGEVTLRGEVQSRQEKRAAEDCAEDVAGVKDVTNQLRVRASSGRGMGDDSERESERSSNVPYNRSTAGSTTSGTSSTSSSRSGTSTSTSDRAGSTKNT